MENHLKPAFGDAIIEIARGVREKRESSTSSPTPWDEPDMSSYSKSSQTCCGGSEMSDILMLNPPCSLSQRPPAGVGVVIGVTVIFFVITVIGTCITL
jgi:hypothetical protein